MCVYTCTYRDVHCNILLIAKIREIIWIYTNKGFAKLQYMHKTKYYAAFKPIHCSYLYLSRTSSLSPPPHIYSQQLLSILLMLGKLWQLTREARNPISQPSLQPGHRYVTWFHQRDTPHNTSNRKWGNRLREGRCFAVEDSGRDSLL